MISLGKTALIQSLAFGLLATENQRGGLDGLGMAPHYRKTEMTPKMKKARKRTKAQRQARKNNRK